MEKGGIGLREYKRELELAGLTGQLQSILSIPAGEIKTLCYRTPRDLFEYVVNAKGSQPIINQYNEAKRNYEEALQEQLDSKQELRNQKDLLNVLTKDLEDYEKYVETKKQRDQLLIELTQGRYNIMKSKNEAVRIQKENAEKKLEEALHNIPHLSRDIQEKEGLFIILKNRHDQLGNKIRIVSQDLGAARNRKEEAQKNIDKILTLRPKDSRLEAIDVSDLAEEAGVLENQGNWHLTEAERLQRETLEMQDRAQRLNKGIREEQIPENLTCDFLDAYLIATNIEPDPKWRKAVEAVLREHRSGIITPGATKEQLIDASSKAPGRPVYSEESQRQVTGVGLLAHIQINGPIPETVLHLLESTYPIEPGAEPAGDLCVTLDGTIYCHGWALTPSDLHPVLGVEALHYQAEYLSELSLKVIEKAEEERKTAAMLHTQANEKRELVKEAIKVQQWHERQEDLVEAKYEFENATKEAAKLDGEERELSTAWEPIRSDFLNKSIELDKLRNELSNQEELIEDLNLRLPVFNKEIEQLEQSLKDFTRREDVNESWFESENLDRARPINEVQPEYQSSKNTVERMESSEAHCTNPDIRIEYQVKEQEISEFQKNLDERETVVKNALEELERVRDQYNQVVLRVVTDYQHRVQEIARNGGVKVVARRENINEESLDNAELYIEVGFDGKPPAPMNSGHLSGGQKTVTSIILLLALTDPGDEDGFFLIDEPYADLDFTNVVRVNQFLRCTGSQYVISVATKTDVEYYEGADMQLALQKANVNDKFAPTPTLMERKS